MSEFVQFSSMSLMNQIDPLAGVISGVCVVSKGPAKGHGLLLDDKSIDQFLQLALEHKDGVKVRFGDDHDAGASDINGVLKNFRRDGDHIRADMHLLKSDKNFSKIIEMAKELPNEFGLSASTTATEELQGHDKYVRFTEIFCVDIVSNPAATKGLFLSQTKQQPKNKTMTKEFAQILGLPETATESEIKLALEACKMDAEAKRKLDAEAKKKLDADADAAADDEEKGKEVKKKFSAELDAIRTEFAAKFAAIEQNTQAAKDSAHKAEIEGLKLEASKDGKIIPIGEEALVKLSIPEIKDMIAKLPKAQLKLSRGNVTPVVNGQAVTDKKSPEYKIWLKNMREEGALKLGQLMVKN